MQETIRLREVLRLMDATDAEGKPIPFSITFFSADLERNTGGEKTKIDARIVTKYRQFGSGNGEDTSTGAHVSITGKSKNPNHGINFTRNLIIPGKEHPVKVHPRLITHFNNMRVVW